jgi:hypothetical protein
MILLQASKLHAPKKRRKGQEVKNGKFTINNNKYLKI